MFFARPTQSNIKSTHPVLIKSSAVCLGSEDGMYHLNLGITLVDSLHVILMLQLNHAVVLSPSHFPLGICHEMMIHSPKMLFSLSFR